MTTQYEQASQAGELPRLSRKLKALAPSATLSVDAKAKALKAAGEDVIIFGAGEPDFPTPPHIVEAAVAACSDPRSHKYTPAGGLPELKQAIVAKTLRDSGLQADPGQVVVANGGKHAIYDACTALLDDGDEALIPAPYWTTYPEAVALAGGRPVIVDTDDSTGFKVNVEQLEQYRTSHTKMLVFVSPSNPTGAMYDRSEIEAIGRWAADNRIWVLCDEIYEHFVYAERQQHSLPVVVPEVADRCVVVNGVSKTYAMTGWRVGWLIAPGDVAAAVVNFQSQTTSNVANVSQLAALAALQGDQSVVASMVEAFDRRRRLTYSMLSEMDGISCIEPQGAFYAFPSVKGLLGRTIAGKQINSSADLAELAIAEAKVAVVPGEAFGAPGFLRLSYALSDEQIAEGLSRLAKLFESAGE